MTEKSIVNCNISPSFSSNEPEQSIADPEARFGSQGGWINVDRIKIKLGFKFSDLTVLFNHNYVIMTQYYASS